MMSICGLITIVDRGKSAAVQRIYKAHDLNISLILRAHGTANSEIMDMLGLDEPEKEIVLAVAPWVACRGVFGDLRAQLHFDKPGTGIAFTCTMSGISIAVSDQLAALRKKNEAIEAKEAQPMETKPMEMIMTVVDSGSIDLAVTAAKAAGAYGGTVIKAREVNGEAEKKIFGITLEPEKEILLMLVRADQKKDIFKAVCTAVFEHTGEHALAFTMPVTDTVGLKG